MRVVLPSNASVDYFPNNSLARYTVKLPQALDLSNGKWECGIAEIMFHRSWYNVEDAHLTITQRTSALKVTLDDGYYDSAETLIEEINKKITVYSDTDRTTKICCFSYDKVKRSCNFVVMLHKNIKIHLSDSLSKILRLDNNDITQQISRGEELHPEKELPHRYTIKGEGPIRLNSIYNLMVYSDVITTGFVGDVQAPLLRAVPIAGNHWDYQCSTFDKIQYIPVSGRLISTITVYIYTDYGEPVPFKDGRTVVTLDFRRSKTLHII